MRGIFGHRRHSWVIASTAHRRHVLNVTQTWQERDEARNECGLWSEAVVMVLFGTVTTLSMFQAGANRTDTGMGNDHKNTTRLHLPDVRSGSIFCAPLCEMRRM